VARDITIDIISIHRIINDTLSQKDQNNSPE